MSNGVTHPGPKVYLWGERGLVSSFFLDVSATTSFERWDAFLELIRFPAPGRVTAAWSVVEPDFGNKGFGHPDCVARLAFDGGAVAVLLLEAKLTTYHKMSWSSSKRLRKQFNSKLNGQIELNHRLALALQGYAEGQGELREPDWVVGTGYVTPNDRPRVLKDESVRRLVAAELAGRAADEYHHVIMTTDVDAPAPEAERRPLIVVQDEAGPVPLPWERFTPRFHHCSWEKMRRLAEGWGTSLFVSNYRFFADRLIVARTGAEEDESLSSEGVRLLALQPAPEVGLNMAKPTHVHLSWKWHGSSFRLWDFTASEKGKEIKTYKGNVADLLDRAEHGIPYTLTYRKQHRLDRKSSRWHRIVLEKNRERWPELWSGEEETPGGMS
jgi:hypothetical protein